VQHVFLELLLFAGSTAVSTCLILPAVREKASQQMRLLLAGVGRALAEDFLEAGDNVVVCSRNGEAGCTIQQA
jgi:hypothetical protein